MKVATLTMNPAVDVSTDVDRVAVNQKLRCGPPRLEPGGGGVNISVAMKALGSESTALFPCGGPTGEVLRRLLKAKEIDQIPIQVEEGTRQNLTVRDASSSEQYRFVLPGPRLSEDEQMRCLDALKGLEPAPDLVAVSGSFPQGTPPGFMRDAVRAVNALGARLVVDTSGAPLRQAEREGVYLLKPNLRELRDLTDADTSCEKGQEEAMKRLVDQGRCRIAVLSLGAAGVLLATPEGLERLRAPTVSIQSRVGAGDSMVAGIIVGLCRGYPTRKAVQLGVAAGAAAVMTPHAELCRREDVDQLFADMMEHGSA